MTPTDDDRYFARRAKQERYAAATAATPAARRIYLDLASLYDGRSDLAEPDQTRIGIRT